MTLNGELSVEPWRLREGSLDLNRLAKRESLFALSNGHVGLRANLDEGDPHVIPGTYLNGFYEKRPLPYAESGYGNPETGQTVVNVTNGKIIRLMVDDSPFDVRYGKLLSHERILDFRAGVLDRRVRWESPAGSRVRIRSTRLVSFDHRAIAAIRYEVEAVDQPRRIIVQSELVANEARPETTSGDPRVAAALTDPLVSVHHSTTGTESMLMHRTRHSDLMMAAAMDHEVVGPESLEVQNDMKPDWARTTFVCELQPGETLSIVKYLGYGWSSTRSEPAIRDQVSAAMTGARFAHWDGLLTAQRSYLDTFWRSADVEVEGDPVVQQAVRLGLFHVLQAGARTECRAIAAKGLTGPGYDGHAFWDTEAFVLPMLTLSLPEAAADALRWRASTLAQARNRAHTLGLKGATFPWRTINGDEAGAYWPAGTAAFHINAVIASALENYRLVTGDDSLEEECGLEILVETARMWTSLGHHDTHGVWHIDGVTGPDEYTAVVDDNVFTNLMAVRNLRLAADACLRHPHIAERLGVTTEERVAWLDAATAVHIPYDEELGVHQQSENFTRYGEWDFHGSLGRYPLMLYEPYVRLYRKQVIKQPDLVLAMHWVPDAFTDEQKARNLDYYVRRTVRDSSLSPGTHAVICAEVGHLELAHEYLREAAMMDLHDLHRNTRDGVHLASLAGIWTALVEGFGGLREHGKMLRLAPALPEGITRLTFRLLWRGQRLKVDVQPDEVRVGLTNSGEPIRIILYDEEIELVSGSAITRPLRRRTPILPPPPAPPGREPPVAPDQHNFGQRDHP